MNLYATARKLQRALLQRGRTIKINQSQIWFDETERMATKYTVLERQMVNGKKKDSVLIESFRLEEIVKFLADLYKGGES